MTEEIGATKTVQNLGIPVNTIYTWKSKTKAHLESTIKSNGKNHQKSIDEEKSILIKRNKELEKANQILKEALGFFVVNQKK